MSVRNTHTEREREREREEMSGKSSAPFISLRSRIEIENENTFKEFARSNAVRNPIQFEMMHVRTNPAYTYVTESQVFVRSLYEV